MEERAIRMRAGSGRRTCKSSLGLVVLLTASCLSPAMAVEAGRYDPGLVAPAMSQMRSIGARSPLAIFVSPGCHRGDEMLALVDATVGRDKIRWIPFGWRPGDDAAVARVLAEGTAGLDAFVRGGPAGAQDAVGAKQRIAFDTKMFMPLASATGRPPATPTTVLLVDKGEARVWRGATPPAVFADILEALKVVEAKSQGF